MAVNEVVKFSIFTRLEEQVGITTISYKQITPVPNEQLTGSQLNAMAASMMGTLSVAMTAIMAQEATLLGVKTRVTYLLPANDVTGESQAGAGPGTWPTPGYAPRQLCGLIRKRSANGTRRGKGRMYIPFVPLDAMAADGGPVGAYVEGLEDLATALFAPREFDVGGLTALFEPVLTDQTRPPFTITITSMNAASEFATQRRRGSFGRANAPVFS